MERTSDSLVPKTQKPQPQIQARLLSVHEAAIYLGRTQTALRQLVYRGQVPVVRLGGRRVQFDREDLDRIIVSSKVKEFF